MKHLKNIVISVFITGISILTLIYSEKISSAIINSVERCIKVVIPSLFAFMVISSVIIKSGLHKYFSRPFRLISRYILHINENLFSVFLMSFTGGYPVGAKNLAELYDNNEISKKEAERMLSFCYMPSPAFVMGISSVLYSSKKAGIIIYLSIAVSTILFAVISGFFAKVQYDNKSEYKIKISSETIISSVESSAVSLFKICIMIIFSSVIIAFVDILFSEIGVNENISVITNSLIEITTLTDFKKDIFRFLPFITALFSFGGISVIMQIKAIVKDRFSLKYFFISRIIIAFLSAIVSEIAVKFISITVSKEAIYIGSRENSVLPSIILIIMIIYLLWDKKTVAKRKNM
ncbi:MAG: hypothetical protein IKL70_08010 [Oscillospiraceae bacterium]|nr:hypothetical protein [Oscillospiraceae bacterium]